jgi:hypothetical protein
MATKAHKSSAEYMEMKKTPLLGKSVRYIGMGDRAFCCPSCDRTFNRGMTFEHDGKLYCSRNCIEV